MTARNFFNEQEQQIIVDAITRAEMKTSGEIRVHLENFCFSNPLKVAGSLFTKLNMHQTAERNGVLIYIATISRKIAIVGDEGIHKKLGTEYWNKLVETLVTRFRENRKAEALAACILECGDQLGKYFPRSSDDKDELSNNLSFK
jgi:uncharacterized membrane protein